jgi:hypothetical protein
MAMNAVRHAYQANESNYNLMVARQLEMYGVPQHSSAAQQAVIKVAQSFASSIVRQIGSIPTNLSYGDKRTFWTVAGGEIKNLLNQFCSGRGVTQTDTLDRYINSLTQV